MLYQSAIQFQQAGLRCFDHPAYKKFESPLPVAIIINLSLSAELFLRYILELNGKEAKEHHLKLLFEKLDQEDQNKAIKNIEYYLKEREGNRQFVDSGFDNMLGLHADMFYNYMYLDQNIERDFDSKANFSFLNNFTAAMQSLAKEKRKAAGID